MPRVGEDVNLDLPSLRALYADGGSPVALIEAVYARLGRHADCGAWTCLVAKEDARSRAQHVARIGSAGLPLYGVPFSVKDNIDAAGLPTTAGCPAFAYVPARSASVVERMEAAGAILIGKNTMDQFATGLVGIRSAVHPVNCFDAARVPGGSSSGSAVAVALGLVSLALGSDTGGSGRVPAALNNVVGYKPTPGIVSTAGMVYANRSFDCVPVFTLTCADAAAAMEVLVGEDDRDPFLIENPAARRGLPDISCGLTIGVPAGGDFGPDADAPVAACFAAALERLRDMGASVVEIDFAPFRAAGEMLFGPLLAERMASVGRFIAGHRAETHPVVAEIVLAAARYTAVDVVETLHRLAFLRAEMARTLRRIDVLAVPTTIGIPTIAQAEADPVGVNARLGRFTYFANPLGLCAVAVPAAMRPDGLPFGLCLAAAGRTDAALLAIAGAFQTATGLRPGRV